MGNCNCRDEESISNVNFDSQNYIKLKEKFHKMNNQEKYFKPYRIEDEIKKEHMMRYKGKVSVTKPKAPQIKKDSDTIEPILDEEDNISEKKAKMTGKENVNDFSKSRQGCNNNQNNELLNSKTTKFNSINDINDDSLFYNSNGRFSNKDIRVENSATFSIKDDKTVFSEQVAIRENYSYLRNEIVKTSFLIGIIKQKKLKTMRSHFLIWKKNTTNTNVKANLAKMIHLVQLKKILVNKTRLYVISILKELPIKNKKNNNIYATVITFSSAIRSMDLMIKRKLYHQFKCCL